MYTVKKSEPGSWRKYRNPNQAGSKCSDCGIFIDYLEEAWFHTVIKGLVFCINCWAPQRKYHNTPREHNGITYHSTLERDDATILDLRVQAGEIKSWRRQVEIRINVKFVEGTPVLTDEPELDLKKQGVPFKHITNYRVDFVITHNDGSIELQESKGKELPTWMIKWALVEALYKDRGIQLTVSKDKKKRKKKWATAKVKLEGEK